MTTFQKDSILLFRKPFRYLSQNILCKFFEICWKLCVIFWDIWDTCVKHFDYISEKFYTTFQETFQIFLPKYSLKSFWNVLKTFQKIYFLNSFHNTLKTFHEIFRHLRHFPKTLSKHFREFSCNFLEKVSNIFQEIFLNVYCTDIWTF